jgi:hypothetical protein
VRGSASPSGSRMPPAWPSLSLRFGCAEDPHPLLPHFSHEGAGEAAGGRVALTVCADAADGRLDACKGAGR